MLFIQSGHHQHLGTQDSGLKLAQAKLLHLINSCKVIEGRACMLLLLHCGLGLNCHAAGSTS